MAIALDRLVARAAHGPAEARSAAFGELVKRYQDAAYAYAYALLGDREAAQDAAQEAFLAAYRSLGQLREAEAFAGWLRRIVRTHCLRAARSSPRSLDLTEAETVPAADDPTAAAEAGELRAALAELIRALPPREREATVLFYVFDRPQEEIAAFLGVPANTVKKRLQAARARMQGQMEDAVRETLRAHAPSRSDAFADAVQFLAGLDAAAAEGELRLVELMAIDGVELDAPDRNGRTLLGWAAERGHVEAAQLLVDAGARVNARDGEGRTALARAIDAGQREVVELLRKHGGRL